MFPTLCPNYFRKPRQAASVLNDARVLASGCNSCDGTYLCKLWNLTLSKSIAPKAYQSPVYCYSACVEGPCAHEANSIQVGRNLALSSVILPKANKSTGGGDGACVLIPCCNHSHVSQICRNRTLLAAIASVALQSPQAFTKFCRVLTRRRYISSISSDLARCPVRTTSGLQTFGDLSYPSGHPFMRGHVLRPSKHQCQATSQIYKNRHLC